MPSNWSRVVGIRGDLVMRFGPACKGDSFVSHDVTHSCARTRTMRVIQRRCCRNAGSNYTLLTVLRMQQHHKLFSSERRDAVLVLLDVGVDTG